MVNTMPAPAKAEVDEAIVARAIGPQDKKGLLRELRKASLPPHKVNTVLSTHFRALAEQASQSQSHLEDLRNALTFMSSQREYKILLDRYNPLGDLTTEERIHATARRVGLDMPVTHKAEGDN